MTSFMTMRMHARADMGACKADMGSSERAAMRLESRAVPVRVTKHFVTILSKTCNKQN